MCLVDVKNHIQENYELYILAAIIVGVVIVNGKSTVSNPEEICYKNLYEARLNNVSASARHLAQQRK